MRRRNAFERPLHPAQLLAVGVIVEAAGTFFSISAHELPPPERRTCMPLFATQLLIVALLFVLISLRDPALRACDGGDNEPPLATSAAAFLDRRPRVKCAQCGVYVTLDSHHCRACGKCVAGYDHHCVYLNTCIGARNYPLFVGLLSCTILLLVTYVVVTGYAITSLRSGARSNHSVPTVRLVALCVLSLPPLLQLVCTLVLGAFHLYFWVRGVSTYEFLHERHERHERHTSASSDRPRAPKTTQTLQILLSERSSDDANADSRNNGTSPQNEQAAATPACASDCAQQEPHVA